MTAAEGCLFDVSRSVTGRAWHGRRACARNAEAIAEHHGLPELLGRVLAGRNVPLDTVESYLNPTLRDLMPDPSALTDMDRAVDRMPSRRRVI